MVVALVALAGCANLKDQFHPPFAAAGGSALTDSGRPDWLRDPARGEYPYSPRGW